MSNQNLDRAAEMIGAQRNRPDLAALEPVEQAIIAKSVDFAPELDRRLIGAAWMMLGDAIGQLSATGALRPDQVAVIAQLAGHRLYTETGREIPCPASFSSGAACKFVARSVHESVLDAQMRAHFSVYHPGATWPPEPEAELCDRCGKLPAELIVGTISKPDGTPGDVTALCFQCHRKAEDTTWIKRAPGRVAASPPAEAPEPHCTCGAAATLAVGYRGEPEALLQCVPCATADPRPYFGHRDLADPAARIAYSRHAAEPIDRRHIEKCSRCTEPILMSEADSDRHFTVDGVYCDRCLDDYAPRYAAPARNEDEG